MAQVGGAANRCLEALSRPGTQDLQRVHLCKLHQGRPRRTAVKINMQAAATEPATAASPPKESGDDLPLLVRAIKGMPVHRPPVWMMRQAGRYMKVYQDLAKKHPTFRERSENADLSTEISLQPWRAFRPDGVILFSDILTPLTGMGIDFQIGEGIHVDDPIRTLEQVHKLRKLNPAEALPYVGETLRTLRAEVGNEAAVLGFVGAPFTLACYIVEGGSSKNKTYQHIKRLAFGNPEVLHALLSHLADSITDYVRYQADQGAQMVQIFDSWASELSPQDFDVFSRPYISRIIDSVRSTHPDLPITLFISDSGGLLERMALTKPDCISIHSSIDLQDGIKRIGPEFAVQGNIDPGILFGTKEAITQRIIETVKQAKGTRHILNLGHGVLVGTPEENVEHFFKVAKELNYDQL
ncbi:hypothetical protein WJX74_003651 [Apatococcus lobatus]|uniref:Uroporphyrinogen decarboxylase n=2 Tax=Apatococcus TaxID=904362 RepID=A0AAW1SB43_9CHLO